MKRNASQEDIQLVECKIESLGYKKHLISGVLRTVVAAVGDKDKEPLKALRFMSGVEEVLAIRQPYKLASRSAQEDDTLIHVNGTQIGGGHFSIFAGPCSVETEEQIQICADSVKKTGCQFIRGGAYKPRTSPYSFQGLEKSGLELLKQAKKATGLNIITELVSPEQVDIVASYTDVIQIGARNMQNFPLLKEVGKLQTPVFLKRGLSATLKDFLMAAEYILSEGNSRVVLCERGIRTFETAYRNTLDLNAVPALKKMTHLPIIVDPSHGTGRRDLIEPMAKASIAAGADGLMIEMHNNPDFAWSDGEQSLAIPEFEALIEALKPHILLAGKKFV